MPQETTRPSPAVKADAAISPARYGLLCFAVVCQLLTIAITWDVWQPRLTPPNIPLFSLPAIPFGWLAVASVVSALIWPRHGVLAHAIVVTLSCVFDMYRMQPQFIALIVLMFACVSDAGLWAGRWYLAAMWFWAGLHKLLSPEWMGSSSWWYLQQSGILGDGWHWPFAMGVALVELGLGVIAMIRPQAAAAGCALMHLGVLITLSPLVRNFNPSVWPWNLASAVVGYWILRQTPPRVGWPWQWLVPATLLIVPAGFYVDWVNPHLASVLYSGHMPRAYHTIGNSVRRLDGWGGLAVPFPDSPHLLKRSFELSGKKGDKLYIQDPRPWLADRYYVLGEDGQAVAITREQFLSARDGGLPGIEMPDPEVVWRLKKAGVELTAVGETAAYAAAATGDGPAAALCRELPALPNLRELKIKNAKISWVAFPELPKLAQLEMVELSGCQAPPSTLPELLQAAQLRYLHWESTALPREIAPPLSLQQQLEVLRLPSSSADDKLLASLLAMSSVTWLDLCDTPVTDRGASHLQKFPNCTWINLSGTPITSVGAAWLKDLKRLEVVELARTQVTDEGVAALAGLDRLEHLNLEATAISDGAIDILATMRALKQLNLRGTQITAAGANRLAAALPACTIVR
jgi:hypothetical protein